MISQAVSQGICQGLYSWIDNKQRKHFPGYLKYSCKICTVFGKEPYCINTSLLHMFHCREPFGEKSSEGGVGCYGYVVRQPDSIGSTGLLSFTEDVNHMQIWLSPWLWVRNSVQQLGSGLLAFPCTKRDANCNKGSKYRHCPKPSSRYIATWPMYLPALISPVHWAEQEGNPTT